MKSMKLRSLIPILGLVAMVSLAPSMASADSLDVFTKKAGKSMLDKDYDRAIHFYARVLELDPDNYEAIKNLGLAYSASGNRAKALEFFERTLKANPSDPDNHNNLGVYYSDVGDPEKAIDFFEDAVAIDSMNPVTLTNLGQEYSRVGRIGKAFATVATSQQGQSAQPHHHLCDC